MATKRIPIILDTDIGSDIDDTWALGMMVNSPELDVKLIVSATGDTTYRAKLVAKFLESVGRADIPIGVGIPQGNPVIASADDSRESRLAEWVKDYDLGGYPGKIHSDGVEAIIQAAKVSEEPATLLAIAPLTNIGEVLRRSPETASACNFVGMHGSVYWGYGKKGCVPEYNVHKDVDACRGTFAAPWKSIMITPLDTCERVVLSGEKYRAVQESPSSVARTILENYRVWEKKERADELIQSTHLFDTVAIYMAFCTELLSMEEMRLVVTDDGRTVPDPAGNKMCVAMDWKNLPAFEDLLVRRLMVN